ncbi:hypothetical protein [Kitasatospora camelliae]|uniref:Uncharacterized protein n=1 Tax=Kitasatospora camelliae TaxID=3156397 RepID=A0AAU8KAR5_9ACTN
MTGTERALLVGVLGPADRPERLLIKLADGRQEVTARLEEAAARVVAAATRFHPVLPHTPASLTHWVEGGLPIRVTRTHTSADNTGPLSFAGLDTAPRQPNWPQRGPGWTGGATARSSATWSGPRLSPRPP